MAQQSDDQKPWGGILDVAAGEKSFKVAMTEEQMLMLGGTLFLAMFLATFLALLITKRL